MKVPNQHKVASEQGGHQLHYLTWGEPREIGVLCVHGLARNARDFDFIAEQLAETHYVVCVDVVGRGESDWLDLPENYTYPQYLADLKTVIDHSGLKQIDWIGTSMGGLLGMIYASFPQTPVRRLVLNDVGYYIPIVALQRIADYLQPQLHFPSFDLAERYLRQALATFGPLTEAQFAHLVRHSVMPHPEGGFVPHYDPAIVEMFAAVADQDLDFGAFWREVKCPVLLLRGAESDVLTLEVAEEMAQLPHVKRVDFPEVGHAPSLIPLEQRAVIVEWLAH